MTNDDDNVVIAKISDCRWHNPPRIELMHAKALQQSLTHISDYKVDFALPCFMRQYHFAAAHAEVILNELSAGEVWWDVVCISQSGITYTISTMPESCGHYPFPPTFKTQYVDSATPLQQLIEQLAKACPVADRKPVVFDAFVERFTAGCEEILTYRQSL